MATVVKSMATSGVEGFMVEIEVGTIRGQQQMLSIIGLPDQAVKEAGERIQAAIDSCGYDIPHEKVVISLAPGNVRKRGSHFDLGMIIALLYQTDQITARDLSEYAFIGELSLNGRIRPCNGVLSMVTEARRRGVKSVIVPFGNREEANCISGIRICPVRSLQDAILFLEGRLDIFCDEYISDKMVYRNSSAMMSSDYNGMAGNKEDLDFADVKGQQELIEAVVLGAAGGHNILMIGEPGCGKTMIAQRMDALFYTNNELTLRMVRLVQSIGLWYSGERYKITKHSIRREAADYNECRFITGSKDS